MKKYKLCLLTFLAGCSLPLAFAPFYISLLAFVAPPLLLFSWLYATPREAFRYGFLFGLGFFSVGISWVYVSIHVFGQASVPLAALITAVFICYLSLFFAFQGYYLAKFIPENNLFKLLFVFPCSWILNEIGRTWLFTGFPWLLLGYSQSNTWLKSYAPLLGIYGLSFITVFISAIFLTLFIHKDLKIRITSILAVIVLFFGGNFLKGIAWTHPVGNPIKITMIQGNIPQEVKWLPNQTAKTLALYVNHTESNWGSDLIVWPEAAITLTLDQAQSFLNDLSQLAKQNKTAIITGIPIIDPKEAFNSMITIGEGSGIYRKRHLVPFGEYTPLKPFWHVITDAFNIPMSDFQPGTNDQPPLMAKGIKIAPYICYEVAYPIEFLTFLPQAQLLLTITDDSWFGDSLAPLQHLQMAQMRALETGRYLLFSSNTGVTAVIDDDGQVQKTIPTFEEGELTAMVQPMSGSTPWVAWRMYPLLVILLAGLLIGWVMKIKNEKLIPSSHFRDELQ